MKISQIYKEKKNMLKENFMKPRKILTYSNIN